MDSLKFDLGPPCPTLLSPAGGLPWKCPYGCFRGGLLARRVACGRLLPLWTPHAVRLCIVEGNAAQALAWAQQSAVGSSKAAKIESNEGKEKGWS
jgi:hypothetical protein